MSGVKHDQGKPRHELLDPSWLEGVARVATMGANKYGDRNWELGMSVSRLYGAAQRHMLAFWSGEDFDPESGLHHLYHASASLMMLVGIINRYGSSFDNRPHNHFNHPQVRVSKEDGERWEKAQSPKKPANEPAVDFARVAQQAYVAAIPGLFPIDIFKPDPAKTLTIKSAQRRIVEWADKAFPGRKSGNALSKMVLEEIPELVKDLSSPGEYADVLILLLDLAHLNKVDIVQGLIDKMDKNESSDWFTDPESGLFKRR